MFLNDLLVFDIPTLTWTNVGVTAFGSPPPPRISHGLTSANGNIFLYGGQEETSKLSEECEYDYEELQVHAVLACLGNALMLNTLNVIFKYWRSATDLYFT